MKNNVSMIILILHELWYCGFENNELNFPRAISYELMETFINLVFSIFTIFLVSLKDNEFDTYLGIIVSEQFWLTQKILIH